MGVEIMSWSVTVSPVKRAPRARATGREARGSTPRANAGASSKPTQAKWRDAAVYERSALKPGAVVQGPALIVEDQTTIVVTADFDAHVKALGYSCSTSAKGS